jgi:hypothetical protein
LSEYACVPLILLGVEILGITMYEGMPKVRAARARACAWFPALEEEESADHPGYNNDTTLPEE